MMQPVPAVVVRMESSAHAQMLTGSVRPGTVRSRIRKAPELSPDFNPCENARGCEEGEVCSEEGYCQFFKSESNTVQ